MEKHLQRTSPVLLNVKKNVVQKKPMDQKAMIAPQIVQNRVTIRREIQVNPKNVMLIAPNHVVQVMKKSCVHQTVRKYAVHPKKNQLK